MWRSIGKGVLFKTFDVKVQVHFVPELWRQTFWKVLHYGTSHIEQVQFKFHVNVWDIWIFSQWNAKNVPELEKLTSSARMFPVYCNVTKGRWFRRKCTKIETIFKNKLDWKGYIECGTYLARISFLVE